MSAPFLRWGLLTVAVGVGHAGWLAWAAGPAPTQGRGPVQVRVQVRVRVAAASAPVGPAHRPIAAEAAPTAADPRALWTPAEPVYWPADALDRRPVPVSAPDTGRLDGLVLSGLPVSLRLLIDATGRVVDVQPIVCAPDDAAALPRLRAMFAATAFIPGRRAGRDVPSRLDLELNAVPMGEAG